MMRNDTGLQMARWVQSLRRWFGLVQQVGGSMLMKPKP